jgi:hypothetical protein
MKATLHARRKRMHLVIKEFLRSGLTRAAFCKRNQVPLSTLSWWLRKHRIDEVHTHHSPQVSKGPLFVPLISSPRPADGSSFELFFVDGRRLQIPASLGIDDLVRLIGALTPAS